MSADQSSKVPVHGKCDPQFEPLRQIFEKHLSSGHENGGSIHVSIAGKSVVDLWGGYKDEKRTKPWTEDTIGPIWSTTKTVTALAVLLLVDRGLLDVDAPVTKYWPEFAGDGRNDVLVRHLLSHTSGFPGWPTHLETEELYDIPAAADKLVNQSPWWKPGSQFGYETFTFGYILDGLVRRVSGKPLIQLIREELAVPREADFYLGVPESEWGRIAELTPPPPLKKELLNPEGMFMRVIMSGSPDVQEPATPGFRLAGMGAAGGFSNARALNRILSIVSLNGTVDGQQFLSPSTIDQIFRVQANGLDVVTNRPVRFGIGFGLPMPEAEGTEIEWMLDGRVCYWTGWGGSIGMMDLDNQMTITYTMNRMGAGFGATDRTADYVTTIYECLKISRASRI
ncbi:beta-lactamase [Penicillium macrosclerotiorum]|uniref:beta-lactamase n=1 Tax=Penicillium macrosclerotiorum TaxID=303699 RepID=UPI002548E527|nr:beta-lactamase [Penicillium macrosclerotiorum]KAJ5675717.1 beta-lactamase [Penicillium macrosclerotiorum]